MTSTVQEYFKNFEKLKIDPFESKEVLLDDSNKPDKNFYNNIWTADTLYYFPSEILSLSDKLHINSDYVSTIHLNIRSGKKNFEKLKGPPFSNRLFLKTWRDVRSSPNTLLFNNMRLALTNCAPNFDRASSAALKWARVIGRAHFAF